MKPPVINFTRSCIVLLFALYTCGCAPSGQGPVTWLDRPLDGQQFSLGPIIIQAHGSGNDGVRGFEFFVNETLVSSPSTTGNPFSQAAIEWLPPAPGTYVIRARAIGGAAGTGSEAQAVIVVHDARPTPATTQPQVQCTPQQCNSNEVFYCPGNCPGSCGMSCATRTPTAYHPPLPGDIITVTPVTTQPQVICTPLRCNSDEVRYCAGNCPGSCGVRCATRTPTPAGPLPPPPDIITVTPVNGPLCPGVPVISSFAANPATITAGGSARLVWGPIRNADSARINDAVESADLAGGAALVSPPTTTTYVLAATGCGGTVMQSVAVTVLPTPPVCPGPPVIASFSANPATITAGQSTTLSWGAVSNATSASIEPGIGGVGTPGHTVVSPGGTTTYTLTASGCGGTVRRQVTVNVNPASQPPIVPVDPTITIVMDKTPPSVSGVNASPTMLDRSGCGSKLKSAITARATDARGVKRVIVRLGGVGSGEVGMTSVGGDTYRAEIGPFSSTGQVSTQVVAWDTMGNSAQAGGPSISVVCIQ